MKSFAVELSAYGIPAEAVVEFGAHPSPREVRYLDLFKHAGEAETEVLPTGVIESASLSEILCVRHTIPSKEFYAPQHQQARSQRQNGTAANLGQTA